VKTLTEVRIESQSPLIVRINEKADIAELSKWFTEAATEEKGVPVRLELIAGKRRGTANFIKPVNPTDHLVQMLRTTAGVVSAFFAHKSQRSEFESWS